MTLIGFDHIGQKLLTKPKLRQNINGKEARDLFFGQLLKKLAAIHNARIVDDNVDGADFALDFGGRLSYLLRGRDVNAVEEDTRFEHSIVFEFELRLEFVQFVVVVVYADDNAAKVDHAFD
jgi:uncharacterized protein (DUF1330 family)